MGLETGWLSPDCVLYPCGYMGHLEASEELVKKNGIQSREEATGSRYLDDDALLAAGWFKITRRIMLGNGGLFVCFPRPYDDDRTNRLRTFLQQHITEQHKAVFREHYFNDPSDFDPDTVLDFVDYGIIEKEELVDKNVLPEWWRE